jgi:photosystem II stability/assembly factor-like uncharacterized protein
VLLALASLLCLSAIRTAAAESGWRRQESGTLAQLRTVFFLDQDLGWAAGARGTLLRTDDGGANWKAQPRPGEDTIRDLIFWDPQEGLALCEHNIFLMRSMEETRSYLLRTTDGGAHWEPVELLGNEADARFTRFVLAGNGRAWLMGETGALYLTVDRGETWKKQIAPMRYLMLGGTFLDRDHGWLTGGGATVARTSDGGRVWRTAIVRNAPNVRFASVSFVSALRGWAVGNGGAIFTTADGGRTWSRQASGTGTDLSDVKFVDQSEGWVIGAGGTLLHTLDGGAHWSVVESGTTHPLERLIILDRNRAWAVGFGGTILALSPSGRGTAPVLRGSQ